MHAFSEEGTYVYTANKDGSATLETCEEPIKATGKTVFDDLTGMAIEWISGKFDIGQAGTVCSMAIIQNSDTPSIAIKKGERLIGYYSINCQQASSCCYGEPLDCSRCCKADLTSEYCTISPKDSACESATTEANDKIKEQNKKLLDKYEKQKEKECTFFGDNPTECAPPAINCEEGEYCDPKSCTCKLKEKIVAPLPPLREPKKDPLFEGKNSKYQYNCLPNFDRTVIKCREGIFSPAHVGGLYDWVTSAPEFEFYRKYENNEWVWKLRSNKRIIDCGGISAEEVIPKDNICYKAIFGK